MGRGWSSGAGAGAGAGLGAGTGAGVGGGAERYAVVVAAFAIAILEAPLIEGVDLGATLRWRTLNPKPFLLSCRELLCDCAGKEV